MNVNGCSMMKKKGSYIRGLNKMNLMKMVLVGLALVTQGCVDENDTREYRNVNRELVLSEFEDTLNEAGNSLEKLMDSRRSETNTERTSLLEGKQRKQQLKSILKPVMTSSTNLLKTYGISEDFLEQELGRADDPRMVLIGLWLAEAEQGSLLAQQTVHTQRADFAFFFQENSLSADKPDWMECMIVAVGVDAIIEFFKGNVTEAIAKKAIRKIASRTLGWVGVGLALYEYGSCMEWY